MLAVLAAGALLGYLAATGSHAVEPCDGIADCRRFRQPIGRFQSFGRIAFSIRRAGERLLS